MYKKQLPVLNLQMFVVLTHLHLEAPQDVQLHAFDVSNQLWTLFTLREQIQSHCEFISFHCELENTRRAPDSVLRDRFGPRAAS